MFCSRSYEHYVSIALSGLRGRPLNKVQPYRGPGALPQGASTSGRKSKTMGGRFSSGWRCWEPATRETGEAPQ
ncbi:hypothetical protein BJY01DRAFT_201736 [Aspergillus pseudoustus]|uniref:Uncharacterized protein n=1 Tax=Aspergillus pseudoustus TaxID=1810923 RepID=A0ABR4L0H9_9EURO